jgi:hypothetical protein
LAGVTIAAIWAVANATKASAKMTTTGGESHTAVPVLFESEFMSILLGCGWLREPFIRRTENRRVSYANLEKFSGPPG